MRDGAAHHELPGQLVECFLAGRGRQSRGHSRHLRYPGAAGDRGVNCIHVHGQRAVRLLACSVLAIAGLLSPAASGAKSSAISFSRQIAPIFKRNCNGCHYPGKLKGELDLTVYPSILKGGKHGAALKPGDPKAGTLMEEISGAEPSMPKEGEPLSDAELALIE